MRTLGQPLVIWGGVSRVHFGVIFGVFSGISGHFGLFRALRALTGTCLGPAWALPGHGLAQILTILVSILTILTFLTFLDFSVKY